MLWRQSECVNRNQREQLKWITLRIGSQVFAAHYTLFSNARTCNNIIYLEYASFCFHLSEAVNQPFSIVSSEPIDEKPDSYDIIQAMQEVQIQAHAASSNPVNASG